MGREVPLNLLPDELKQRNKEVPLDLLPPDLQDPPIAPQAEDLSRLERTGRMIAGTAGQMESAGGQVLQVGGRLAKKAGQGYKDLSEFVGGSTSLDMMGKFLERGGGATIGAGKAVAGQGRALAEKMAFENPDLMDKVVGAFTSTAVAMIPAIGVVKGASLLKFAPTIARNLGISANVLLESSLEAGAVREDLIQSGKSEEEADSAAYKTFFANIPTIAITDKLGVFAKTNTMTGKVARAMISNAAQEAAQTGISNVATDKTITEGMGESALLGAIIGGPFGALETIAEGKGGQPPAETQPQAPQTVPLAPNVTPTQLERARTMGTTDPIAALKSITPAAQWDNIDVLGREIIQSIAADTNVPADQKQIISAQVLNRILDNSIRPAIEPIDIAGKPVEATPGKEAGIATVDVGQAANEQMDVITKAAEQIGITGEDLDVLMPDKEAGMKLLTDTIATGKEQGKTTEQIAADFADALTPPPVQESTAAMPTEIAIDEIRAAAPEERLTVPEAALQHEADILTAESEKPIPVSEEKPLEQGPSPDKQSVIKPSFRQTLDEQQLEAAKKGLQEHPTAPATGWKQVTLPNGDINFESPTGYRVLVPKGQNPSNFLAAIREVEKAQGEVSQIPDEDMVSRLQGIGQSEPEAKANAGIVAAFYAAEANRQGKTVEQYQKENPLPEIVTEKTAGEVLEQEHQKTKEFKSWFGDSKVVDDKGEPLTVYHGSPAEFTEFDTSKIGILGTSEGKGFYFTSNPKQAEGYKKEGGKLYQVHLSIKKPMSFEQRIITDDQLKKIFIELFKSDPDALSNYGDVEFEGRNKILSDAVKTENEAESDIDLMASMINGGISTHENIAKAFIKVTGYDGVITDWRVDESGKVDKVYVAFLPNQIKDVSNIRPTSSPDIFKQGTRGFYSQAKNLIGLLKGADQSTFLHESAHAWLTQIWDHVRTGAADEAYKAHWAPMAEWLGVTKGQKTITREQHEKFAAGFESYLREGKAPNTGLKRAFQQFRAWLLKIYGQAKIGGVELSKEARAFYDRMLTSQKADVEAIITKAKEAESRGELTLRQEPVKRIIARTTGVSTEQQEVITNQSKLLRFKLRSEARAARESARATKAEIMADLRASTKNEADIKAAAVSYVTETVPKELRYKALRAIANAKTNIQLGKIIVAADKVAAKAYSRQLAQDIKKVAQRAVDSSKVDVDYKSAVRELMSEIDLVSHRPDTMLRIKAMKEYVETARESGRLQFISENITKALDILTRRPITDISEHELENILRDLHIIELVGREAQAQKEALDSLTKNMWVEDLVKPGIKHIKMSAEAQKMAKAWGWAQDVYWSLAPIDIIMDRMDGGKGTYDGPHYAMKKIIDGDFLNFLNLKREYIQPVLELVKKHGLKEVDMEKIGIYALKIQANGTARVLASMPELTEEYVTNLTLTSAEMEVYQKMRDGMEKTYPLMKKLMGKLYNKEVGSVENYFTMLTDWDKLTDMEVEERLSKTTEQFSLFKKNVKAGFSKTRQPGAVSPVMVNAMKVYMQHMNDVLYFIAMQENIKKFSEITKDERYTESVGPEGRRIIQSWFDLLARQGRAEGSKRIWAIPGIPSVNIDTLRKNIGAATLGLKLTSVMIQTTSFFDAASYVGGANVMEGLSAVISDKQKRDWLNANFPKLRERIGDDLALVDLSEKEWLNKLQQKGYAPLKALDSIVAASTTLAAYQKYAKENDLPIDFTGKPDAKAVAYANKVLSKTQASPFFLDAGIMFGSSKYGFGNASINKAFLQFKQFTTNRWFYMTYDVPKMKAGEIVQAAFYLGMAQAAEMGIRAGSRAALLSAIGLTGYGIAAGVKGADDDDDLMTDYLMNLLGAIPFADSFISAFKYHSLPAPVMDTTAKLFLGPSNAIYAQNEYKRIVALRQTLVALASLTGIPGAAQIGQVATWAYNPNTLTFPYNAEQKGLEDLGESRTYAEQERMDTLKQAHNEFNKYSKAYREAMAKDDLEAATLAAKEAAQVLNQI